MYLIRFAMALLARPTVRYYVNVNSSRNSLIPFFLVSLAFHLFLLLSWPNPQKKEKALEQIPVAFLPAPAKSEIEPLKTPGPAPTRPSKAPVQVAKKSSPIIEEATKNPSEPSQAVDRSEPPKQEKQEKDTIVQRPLPTLKELLPPVTWAPSGERTGNREGPIRLDTREPRYLSYFDSIKRAIEIVWEYPEPALRYGLQGKLVLELTILGNGQLERTRLIRSSGFSVLDQEAIRAVRAASPFQPIPPWIGKSRLDITASFEYHDSRLKYNLVP